MANPDAPRLTHPSGELLNTYVYQTDILRDCFTAISEFAGEFEHAATREPVSFPLTSEFILARKKAIWRAAAHYLLSMAEE
jgi:hypothetical protein